MKTMPAKLGLTVNLPRQSRHPAGGRGHGRKQSFVCDRACPSVGRMAGRPGGSPLGL